MMKLFYDKFAKFAMLRTAVFAVMGIVTLLLSEFLLGPMFYVIVGYVFLCGIWSIADDFLRSKETKAPIRYETLIAAVLMIAFGVLSIIFGRYLIHIAPLYLGGLMLVNGFVYLVVALSAKTRRQWLLTLLSMFVLIGGGAIIIFTLGFEIVLTLSQVSGITLLLSCAYELAIYLIYHKSISIRIEREDIK